MTFYKGLIGVIVKRQNKKRIDRVGMLIKKRCFGNSTFEIM